MVSCIISTWQREPEILLRALQSVRNQTRPPEEIIVVNDAPENRVLSERLGCMIAGLEDSGIVYLVLPKHLGACGARNEGARKAKGEFLAFLDDDDEWLPEKMERQEKAFHSPDIGMVTCGNYRINRQGRRRVDRRERLQCMKSELEGMLAENYIGSVSLPMMRASVFWQAGGFDESMPSCQDADLWIRILQISKVRTCPEPLVNIHISAVSITSDGNARIRGYERMLEKYADLYARYPEAYRLRMIIMGYVFEVYGDKKRARNCFRRAAEAGACFGDIAKGWVKGKIIRIRRFIFHY